MWSGISSFLSRRTGIGGGAPAPAPSGFRATVAGLNHNVKLTALAKGLSGVASGIWAMSTIATYLFMIEDNSNTARTSRREPFYML